MFCLTNEDLVEIKSILPVMLFDSETCQNRFSKLLNMFTITSGILAAVLTNVR